MIRSVKNVTILAPPPHSKKCQIKGSGESLTANCSGVSNEDKPWPTPPQNLTQELKIFDISYNTFDSLNVNCFKRYKKLKKLYMTWIMKTKKDKSDRGRFNITEDLFTSLVNLNELHMTGTLFTTFTLSLKWPPKLLVLRISSMDMQWFEGLQVLTFLETVDFSNNSLPMLPDLNDEAPLVSIDLNLNPIVNVSVLEIARFCQLQEFGTKFTSNSPFVTNVYYYCDCERINIWIERHEILVDQRLKCTKFYNEPGKATEPNIKCDFSFDATILKAYENCKDRSPKFYFWELLLYVLFFSLLFPVLYFAFEAYNRRFRDTESSSKDVSKRRQSKPRVGSEHSPTEGRTSDYDYESHEESPDD